MTDSSTATDATQDLAKRIGALDTDSALKRLQGLPPAEVARLLGGLPPARANVLLAAMAPGERTAVMAAAPAGTDWADSQRYPEGSVGRLLEDPPAVFPSGTKVSAAIEALREVVKQRLVTYLWVVDGQQKLLGVVAFRDLLYGERERSLDEVMIRNPFCLRPDMQLVDAMREVVTRHYPVYPVCEADGHLVGQVRGQVLFEQQAFEISAQAGSMVGVEKEERLATPLWRAFRFRNPWLLVNLLTVFVAAAVVGYYEDTINRVVVLAVFLPVLGGQSGNLGAQSLAVMLRGMTLGELKGMRIAAIISKEGILGLVNGVVTGALAGAAMYWVVARDGGEDALLLGGITLAAMAFSCMIAGLAGSTIPLVLKRLGADPATASSIFLSTMTDVVSMGLFLGLVTWLVL
ncbi:magnesium transporter [Arenimonas caeni]|uniref:Magnesium transporter n=1 Tax=Arenimonas caeni TaxID=2058085 RepID=A0A2P6M641_9GAMM|nr:magnesium transporter [Arenimonas caeni]PRH81464.1 magnesium transporter [Arenimonas caeni]